MPETVPRNFAFMPTSKRLSVSATFPTPIPVPPALKSIRTLAVDKLSTTIMLPKASVRV